MCGNSGTLGKEYWERIVEYVRSCLAAHVYHNIIDSV